jgi:hypothetical protein
MKILSQRPQIAVGCTLFLSLLMLIGCSSKDKNLSLSGKVTYKGEPVTGGSLSLIPTDGKTPPVNTKINGDGTYMIVPPALGKLNVTVETESIRGMKSGGPVYANVPKGPNGEDMSDKLPKRDAASQQNYKPIPPKYSQAATSGLSVDIHSGKNEKTFDLTD